MVQGTIGPVATQDRLYSRPSSCSYFPIGMSDARQKSFAELNWPDLTASSPMAQTQRTRKSMTMPSPITGYTRSFRYHRNWTRIVRAMSRLCAQPHLRQGSLDGIWRMSSKGRVSRRLVFGGGEDPFVSGTAVFSQFLLFCVPSRSSTISLQRMLYWRTLSHSNAATHVVERLHR